MSIQRSRKMWAVVVTVVAAVVVMTPVIRAQKTGPAKICPITIGIAQDSLLARHCAAKIESDNALLSTLLVQLRQRAVPEKASRPAKAYPKSLAAADFLETYLRVPTLTKPDGTAITGWDAVIAYLTAPDGIIPGSTYIDVQSVHVTLEYLPVDSPEYLKVNGKSGDIDFIAHVKTVLAYAPTDDPLTIEGTLCHRKVCEFISCPPQY